MAVERTVLLDTSVLISAVDAARPHHIQSQRIMVTLPCVLTAQNVREFLVVATRPPMANGLGLTIDQALEDIVAIRRVVRLLPEDKPILPILLELIVLHRLQGRRIHDAAIAAAAIAHKVGRICTLDRQGFAGFGLEVVSPANWG